MAKEKAIKDTPVQETPNVETLMQEISNLNTQNAMLKSKLNQAVEEIKFLSQGEFHKKLDWLWKVITLEGAAEVFSANFYDHCVKEFVEMMTPEEPAE